MSETLHIDGIGYMPASTVSKRFGYTSTYILLLARDGKIDGKKIGTRWYIDPTSVERFFKQAQKVQSVRSEHLRTIRKEELHTHERARRKGTHTKALTETLAILVIGLSIGAMGYLGTNTTQTASVTSANTPFFERLALALYALVSPSDATLGTPVAVTNAPGTPLVMVGTTTRTSLVIAPDEVMTTTTIESIRDSFSDDVSVSMNPDNPDTGVIVPHFKEKDGATYRFLMVPVNPGAP